MACRAAGQDLKRRLKISFLFISHDLRVVQYISDRVGVMYLGKIVEYAKTEELFQVPFHPYSGALLASAPKIITREGSGVKDGVSLHSTTRVARAFDFGDVPSPISIPSGCPFHPRCPKRFDPCASIVPELKEKDGRHVACHLWNPF